MQHNLILTCSRILGRDIMKKLIYFTLLMIIISCGEKNHPIENIETENLTQHQIDSILTDFNFDYNNPIFIDRDRKSVV